MDSKPLSVLVTGSSGFIGILESVRKTATPRVEHQAPHPADVPETLASIQAIGAQLGWQPRIIFPNGPDS